MLTHAWEIVLNYSLPVVHVTQEWVEDNMYVTYFIAGMFVMAVLSGGIRGMYKIEDYWKHRKVRASRKDRGRLMTTPERENREKVLIADMICDALEELEYSGKIDRERVSTWYRRFGNLLNLPELLSKHERMLHDKLVLKQTLMRKHGDKIIKKVIPFPDRRTNGALKQLKAQGL